MNPLGCRGFSLVELVVSIVVIATCVGGVLMAIGAIGLHSADAHRAQQGIALAEGYLEEIRLQPLDNPDGAETGGAEAGETRADFDDVQDYDGLVDSPPEDQTGTALPGLGRYTVSVEVTASGALGPGGAQVPAADSYRIDVRVRDDPDVDITLSSYRARY